MITHNQTQAVQNVFARKVGVHMIDLQRLQSDVLSREPEMALPCHLSDQWLAILSNDVNSFLGESDEDRGTIAGLMAVAFIAHLMKLSNQGITQGSMKDMREAGEQLIVELELEQLRRHANWIPVKDQLDSFFDGRHRLFRHMHPSLINH